MVTTKSARYAPVSPSPIPTSASGTAGFPSFGTESAVHEVDHLLPDFSTRAGERKRPSTRSSALERLKELVTPGRPGPRRVGRDGRNASRYASSWKRSGELPTHLGRHLLSADHGPTGVWKLMDSSNAEHAEGDPPCAWRRCAQRSRVWQEWASRTQSRPRTAALSDATFWAWRSRLARTPTGAFFQALAQRVAQSRGTVDA